MNTDDLRKLLHYIEENLRASPTAGMQFVDARQFRTRLESKQNHVVFGRRGAGKTTLVSATRSQHSHVDVYLNLEDYKDITFPNIVIRVVVELFDALLEKLVVQYGRWTVSREARQVKRVLKTNIGQLQGYLHDPDSELQAISEVNSVSTGTDASVTTKAISGKRSAKKEASRSVSRSREVNKLDSLRIKLPDYKKLVQRVSILLSGQPIFLFLDDLYFVDKQVQPELVDYFHRLTKGTDLFLKVSTIKHRSKLYRRSGNQYVGVEVGHDIFEVDMDYTLDNFEELKVFMRELLLAAIEKSESKVSVDELFAGDGFAQLCLASGGVPRDFLSLFVSVAGTLLPKGGSIGKIAVNEIAISRISSKYESMKMDSGDDDGVLSGLLSTIKDYVYRDRRTNAFLLSKVDLDHSPHFRQAIRELVDLRLIHLLDDNTSKSPSDGKRYEAYILDVGLYENSRPRNFNQIQPGQVDESGRRDKLRAAPVFWLEVGDLEVGDEQSPNERDRMSGSSTEDEQGPGNLGQLVLSIE